MTDSPTEEDIGVEALEASIEKLEQQKSTLKKLKHILKKAPEDVDVYVENPRDSGHIKIILRANMMRDTMEKLAWMSYSLQGQKSRPDSIEYDVKKEEYKLVKKFRIDR